MADAAFPISSEAFKACVRRARDQHGAPIGGWGMGVPDEAIERMLYSLVALNRIIGGTDAVPPAALSIGFELGREVQRVDPDYVPAPSGQSPLDMLRELVGLDVTDLGSAGQFRMFSVTLGGEVTEVDGTEGEVTEVEVEGDGEPSLDPLRQFAAAIARGDVKAPRATRESAQRILDTQD